MNEQSVKTETDPVSIYDEDFFYIPELAAELKIPIPTLRKMIERGIFPHSFKEVPDSQTARIRIPGSDVQEFKRSQVQGGTMADNGNPDE